MAYRNDQTERARLRKLWIDEQDLPCAECGSKIDREIAHKKDNGWAECQETTEDNSRVLCYRCHKAEHPYSKFHIGDKVRLRTDTDQKHQAPAHLDFTPYEMSRPRTIISIRYDRDSQCNFYRLGSNGKGKMLDGQPLEGFDYEFRSYQLQHYIPRAYHFKRGYTMSKDDARLTSKTKGSNSLARAKYRLCQHVSQENNRKRLY